MDQKRTQLVDLLALENDVVKDYNRARDEWEPLYTHMEGALTLNDLKTKRCTQSQFQARWYKMLLAQVHVDAVRRIVRRAQLVDMCQWAVQSWSMPLVRIIVNYTAEDKLVQLSTMVSAEPSGTRADDCKRAFGELNGHWVTNIAQHGKRMPRPDIDEWIALVAAIGGRCFRSLLSRLTEFQTWENTVFQPGLRRTCLTQGRRDHSEGVLISCYYV